MKRFRFRLETKLRLISTEENIAKSEVARRLQEYEEQNRLLLACEQELESLYERLRPTRKAFSLQEIIAIREYLPVLQERIQLQRMRSEQAFEELNRARHRLYEIIKERKALEKLKEKRWRAYIKEFHRQEQSVLDEAATSRFYQVRVKGNRS